MTQVVYAAVGAMFALGFSYMTGFYPLYVGLGSLGVIAYFAFKDMDPNKKRAARKEPWYMRE